MPHIKIPTDREITEGEIATYWFDDRILVSLSKPIKRSVELIEHNVTLVKRITSNKPAPLLIYSSNSPVPDKETRKFSAEKCRRSIPRWPWFPNPDSPN